MRQWVGILAAGLLLFLTLPANAQNLGDLRSELSILRDELQSLRSDISASGRAGFLAAGGDRAIDRMNAMEKRLSELTQQTELLQNRINRVVEDGTRRINDIEFRLCEQDPACDLGALTTPELGSLSNGGANISTAGTRPGNLPDRSGLSAVSASPSEQADFNAALEVLDNGELQRAADMFAQVAENHAGGPLTAEAQYLRGTILENLGQHKEAAIAWLDAFTADPNGPRGPVLLLGIAKVVALEGDPVSSCLYLAEIPARFPGSAQAPEAEQRMVVLDCANVVADPALTEALGSDEAADVLQGDNLTDAAGSLPAQE